MEPSKELHCTKINMTDEKFCIDFASPDEAAPICLDFTMYSFELCCLSKNLFECSGIYKEQGCVVDNAIDVNYVFSFSN